MFLKISDDVLRHMLGDGWHLHQLENRRISYVIHGFEMIQQFIPPLGSHTLDIIQHRVHGVLPVQLMMVGDGITVHFLLNRSRIAEQVRPGPERNLPPVPENHRPGSVAVVLRQSHHRNLQLHGIQYIAGGAHLPQTPVHHNHIRQTDEARVTGQRPAEPAVQHLLQAAVVVRALHRLDSEPAVILPDPFQTAEHHHGAHRIHTVGIGNIVGFHPVRLPFPFRIPVKSSCLHQALHFPVHGFFLLPVGLRPHLKRLRHFHQIPPGQIHQRPLAAPLRHIDMHLPALPAQKFFQQFLLLRFLVHQDFPGNPGPLTVVLFQKLPDHIPPGVPLIRLNRECLPAAELAVPHRKQHDERAVPVLHRMDDVQVLIADHGDPLGFFQRLHRLNHVPPAGGLFIRHLRRGVLHPLREQVHQGLVLSGQKLTDLRDRFIILIFVHMAQADPPAGADMIVQTRPVVWRKLRHGAPLQGKELIQQVHNLIHGAGIAEGTEIAVSVPADAAGLHHPGVVFTGGDHDVRIGLVIPEQNIVLRHVLLDQIALQNEGLHLTAAGDVFKLCDVPHHRLHFRTAVLVGGLKVLPHPVAKGDSLPDVNDLSQSVLM